MKVKFLVLAISSNLPCLAQSAKDYFFPAPERNLSVYVKPVTKGRSETKTFVYFKSMGDSALITTVYPDFDGRNGWKEEMVKIKDSRISLCSVKSNIYNPQTYEENEVTLMKLPGENYGPAASVKGSLKRTYRSEFRQLR